MTERPFEPLVIGQDGVPRTVSNEIGCVMKVVSFITDDSRVFRYKTHMLDEFDNEVEWPIEDGMQVVIPADVTAYLLRNGYARHMNAAEVADYNRRQFDSKETGNA